MIVMVFKVISKYYYKITGFDLSPHFLGFLNYMSVDQSVKVLFILQIHIYYAFFRMGFVCVCVCWRGEGVWRIKENGKKEKCLSWRSSLAIT